MQWAIATGIKKVRAEQAAINGEGPGPDEALLAEYAKADELVLSKIRQQIGLDEVHWSVSAPRPASIDVLEFFGAIGLPICELWGMSELSCCATVNPPGRIKLGTVGPALPGVELAIAEDGELLCRGPLVMRGYRNEPEKTAETIDADGWLHTGDVATIDDEGYVRIVDRKKELIINAAGKNMSPANIEAAAQVGLAAHRPGRRHRRPAALQRRADRARPRRLRRLRRQGRPGRRLACRPVPGRRDRGGGRQRRWRRPTPACPGSSRSRRFRILPVDWLPGGDELTPTMKLKRKPIAEKYAAEIDALYTGGEHR